MKDKFLENLSQMRDPIEFLGLAKLLGAPLVKDELDEDGKPIPIEFEEIVAAMYLKYSKLSRKKRREILKIMK